MMKKSGPECWLGSRSAQVSGQKTSEPHGSPSNNRVNATVRPVTPLACASIAPVRPVPCFDC
jgi:hypothetical protein